MKSLVKFIKESKKDLDDLKWDIEELLQDWIRTGDSKRQELKNVESIVDEPDFGNGNVDTLFQQLCQDYDYDEDELGDYLETDEGIEVLKKAAQSVLDHN